VFFEWIWLPADRLPLAAEPWQNAGQDEYTSELQGKPARHTVDALRATLHYVVDRLEPESWV
jgi:hypothetical protein